MKTIRSVAKKVIMGASLLSACSGAMAFVLPSGPCTGNNCETLSDFSVYSLALINLQAGGSGSPTNGEAGYVAASAGQIKDYVVLGLNANNAGAQTNVAGIDDAYNTPSGGTPTFSSLTSDTSNGPGTGDGLSWQASMSVLRNQFLNSNFVAFFAFTEPGTSAPPTPLLGADMLIWAKVSLIDTATTNALVTRSFYLQSNGSTHDDDPLASALPPDTTYGNSANSPWVYVNSKMCVDSGSTFVGFPDASGNCPAGSQLKDTNTGQNNASFAVYNAELDAIVHDASTGYDILQIDWEMAYVNGDGETAWLEPFTVSNGVPEPAVHLLMGVAFLGLWRTQRDRGSRKVRK